MKRYKIDVQYLDGTWGIWTTEAENLWAALVAFREDVPGSKDVREIEVKEWQK